MIEEYNYSRKKKKIKLISQEGALYNRSEVGSLGRSHSAELFHKAAQQPDAQNWSIPHSWVKYLTRFETSSPAKAESCCSGVTTDSLGDTSPILAVQ